MSLNYYTYANNNPIMYQDSTGHFAWFIPLIAFAAATLIGGAANLGGQLISNGGNFGAVDWHSVGTSALGGGVTAATFMLLGPAGTISEAFVAGGTASVAGYTAEHIVQGQQPTAGGVLGSYAVGGTFNAAVVGISNLPIKTAANSPNTTYGSKLSIEGQTLQHEFKHAADYGVTGNWNNTNKLAFEQAIRTQVDSVATPIRGTYRGNISVYHFYNPKTGVNTMIDMSGNFVGGWKLSAQQIANLLRSGNIQ